ncbi:hypothetical protein CTI12_AA156590 [Artemisia annua]|uniref:HTH myb-type domain-containing protein n=1 Tax=Artemisia annua TaxID=35608 RepID=A0A2U1PFS3_ARTAN|nr:hypothetical protein CTI12_AA156590 [Artemisia annua]
MKEEADDAFLLEALENGAFLVVQKKLTNDTVSIATKRRETKHCPKEVDISAARKRRREHFHAEENPDVHLLENENVSAKRSVLPMKKCFCRKRLLCEWTKETSIPNISVSSTWRRKERIHKSGQFKLSSESATKETEKACPKEVDISAARKRERTCHAEENPDVHLLENENVSAKRSVLAMKSVSAGKRPCVEWTKELHSKFISVVRVLGEGNCFPKTILDAMGVPGLTRMQVASHLQSLRKRGTASSSNSKTLSSNHSQDLVDSRMCGRMPLAAVYVNIPEEGSGHHDTFPEGDTYDDFFNFPNGMEGEFSLDYDNSMPNQLTSMFNQHI